MLKERLKSSAILILIFNLIYLTSLLWFFNQNNTLGNDISHYLLNNTVIGRFFPSKPVYSISKDNLSRPRKFLINDGSLWMAYYNTDIGFSPIESRTRKIVTGFLSGDITGTQKIDSQTWEAGLESVGIYVEYPVAFSTDMFCKIMGVHSSNAPSEIISFRDLIILPSDENTNICILIRDASDKNSMYAYMLTNNYSLPASDLSVYTSNDGYYEPAFSTGLEINYPRVSLSSLVLFSDSQPSTTVLAAKNVLDSKRRNSLLESFSFNTITLNPYEDTEGALNYIANYSSAKIYPDSVFEYTAIEHGKGIVLEENTDAYNVLNASIDFAEKTWSSVSTKPLSILLTSDLSGYDSTKPYTFRFDYYESGRPIKVDLPAAYGHPRMSCAIEITVYEGRLISYRQYMRSYESVSVHKLSDTFVTALDSFVQKISTDTTEGSVVIEDIYIGYLDSGKEDVIQAGWLAKTSKGNIYRYTSAEEVSDNELE